MIASLMYTSKSSPALLLIDIQRGFDHPIWGPRNNPDAERQIAYLLTKWRAAGANIIHVRHDSMSPDSPLRPGQSGNDPKLEAMPVIGELQIKKSVNSAFIGTQLEQELHARQVDELIIVGLTTNHCVSTTARMAGNMGFNTFVVEDATATFDGVGIDGKMRTAADVHAAALSDLAGEFASIIDTAAAVARLEAWRDAA